MSKARNSVIKLSDLVSVTDFGAVGDGVANDTTAINNAKEYARDNGKWLLLPDGSYLVSGTVYPITSQAIIINRDFDASAYNPAEQARGQSITILTETPDTTPHDNADSRIAISVTMQGNGSQNGTGIRVNLRNYSDDSGGSTGLYVKAMSGPDASWTAGLHSETRHASTVGGTHALNLECASYTTSGSFYGIVLHNSTATTGDTTHPLTGDPVVAHPEAYGIHILGSNTTDPMGGWVRGINFQLQSMRAGGDCIYVGVNAAVDTVLTTSAAVACAVADIDLNGNSACGISLNGTYTDAALRIGTDQYISLQNNDDVRIRYNTATGYIEFYNGANRKGYIDMAGADHAL